MASTKERKKVIVKALMDLGGTATTRQIAEKAQLNIVGVSQTLGVLASTPSSWLICLGGRRGNIQWKLKNFQKGWICIKCRQQITNEAERSDYTCGNCREPFKKRW